MTLRSILQWYLTYWRRVDYVGTKKCGVPHGRGRILAREFADFHFAEYEGEFVDGLFHGHGRLRYIDWGADCGDQEYEGDFVHGQRGPVGTLRKRNGEIYEGTFENGWPSGRGTATWPNGRAYSGEFHSGEPGWEGFWTWPGQKPRHGRITDHYHQHSIGPGPIPNPWQYRLELEEGAVYCGGCHQGWPDGQGIWTFPDGTQYDGKFVDGIAQEPGRLTLSDGTVKQGRFSLSPGGFANAD